MAEIYVRDIDGFGPRLLDSELLAKIFKSRGFRLARKSYGRVLSVLSEHSRDRDDGPFLPEYILWVAKAVREEIRKIQKAPTGLELEPTKDLFEKILNDATKGFHADRGKIIISRAAWENFRELDSREYSERVFRQIIAEAVAERRKVNSDRGIEIRAQMRDIRKQLTDCY
ncbi:MAG: hypothetical protein WCV72_02430 [Patescibacteria group bacterium]